MLTGVMDPFPCLDRMQLKWIAMVTMFLDHMAVALLPYSPGGLCALLRLAGRMAFPIYCFLLTEGFFHTKDWKKYAVRLGIFALLSEIPFDLMVAGRWWDMRYQNVFFTLLLGLLMMKALDAIGKKMPLQPGIFLQVSVIGLVCEFAWKIHCDYDYVGIMLIALLYWFRNQPQQRCLMGCLWMVLMIGNCVYIPGLIAAFLVIWRYNGKPGRQQGKYFFYWFYPAHMALLYVVSMI